MSDTIGLVVLTSSLIDSMGAALEVVTSRVWETKQCDGPGPGAGVMEWGSGALQPERRAGISDVCGLLSWKCGRTKWLWGLFCTLTWKWPREMMSIRREDQGACLDFRSQTREKSQ